VKSLWWGFVGWEQSGVLERECTGFALLAGERRRGLFTDTGIGVARLAADVHGSGGFGDRSAVKPRQDVAAPATQFRRNNRLFLWINQELPISFRGKTYYSQDWYVMDLSKVLEQLRRELVHLDAAIESLEQLQTRVKRHGRPRMVATELLRTKPKPQPKGRVRGRLMQ
jgi:hypothetical protein